MDMSEDLNSPPAGAAPSQHRIVTQADPGFLIPNLDQLMH